MICPLCEKFMEDFPLVPDEDEPGRMQHILDWNDDGTPGVCSDPIRCAFIETDYFSSDNWCCQAMKVLREIAEPFTVWHNDSNVGTIRIPVVENPEGSTIQQGMLVLAWYKSRGRTGQAIVLWDEEEPKKLNCKTAMCIINRWKQAKKKKENGPVV